MFRSLYARVRQSESGTRQRKRRLDAPLARLQVEQLDERVLPSVTSAFVDTDGDLTPDQLVVGSNGDSDSIVITCDGGSVKVNGADPDSGPVLCADVHSIVVEGGKGDDVIDLRGVTSADFTALASISVSGGKDNDTIFASEIGGAYDGGQGDDALWGGIGADILDGGKGNDLLVGGDGADALFAGQGDDTLVAGAAETDVDGNVTGSTDDGDVDVLEAGKGVDAIFANDGDLVEDPDA